jgi:hypothetical protein
VLQEHFFKNVQEAARNRALLLSYHPFWLRLGMEVVVGKQVAGEVWSVGLACLNAVMPATEHTKHQLPGFDKGTSHDANFRLALFLNFTRADGDTQLTPAALETFMRQHFLKERRPGGKEERAVHPAKHWVRCWQQFAGWERLMVGEALPPPPPTPSVILTQCTGALA